MLIGYKGYILTSLQDMALLRREPVIAALIAINMFSNAGLPPFAGFHGKLYIGIELLRIEAYGLFILIFICSILSCYYYIRFIALIYFAKNEVSRIL
jgi:NADH-quinone oxidoreductase subunit N